MTTTPASPATEPSNDVQVTAGFWLATARALVTKPGLWATAGSQLFALAPNGWWRSAPFLPLPEPSYFAFRVQTAYGNEEPEPKPHDVITYLSWVKDWNRRAQ